MTKLSEIDEIFNYYIEQIQNVIPIKNSKYKEIDMAITMCYQEIVALIKKPKVTEKFIEEKATGLYNYLYYETFNLDQVKDFLRLLIEEINERTCFIQKTLRRI